MQDDTGAGRGTAFVPVPVFLVLESDMLIAADISDALQSGGPCRIIHAHTPAELADLLEGETRISAAILELRLAQVDQSGLGDSLVGLGARIVLTVGEADGQGVAARGWSMLVRPFTDQMLRNLLFAPG